MTPLGARPGAFRLPFFALGTTHNRNRGRSGKGHTVASVSPSIAEALALSVVSAWAATAFAQSTGNPSPCVAEFMRLRDAVQKTGLAAKAGHDKNASREEMCKLIGTFADAEEKWVKFTVSSATYCGIPTGAVEQIKTNHEHTLLIRKQICSPAPVPGVLTPTIPSPQQPAPPFKQNPCVWPVERTGTECKVLSEPSVRIDFCAGGVGPLCWRVRLCSSRRSLRPHV
jgi:hypothetical protein